MLLILTTAAWATCPTTADPWPDDTGWSTTDVSGDAVDRLTALSFPPRDDETRAGVRTDSLLVFHHGALIYEQYGGSYDAETPHLLWSATKSFTNALVGIAVREGSVQLADSICDHIDVGNPDTCAITVVNLLEFSSGLAWRETYENESPTASSVLAMLYGEGQSDMAQFVTSHQLRDTPGTTYQYSSGDTNVLAAIAAAALVPTYGERFPWTALFDPIGITSATWERDGAGTYVGSSYLYMTPRDMGRFGHLLLHDGCWHDERILPEGWVHDSTQVNPGQSGQVFERGPGETQGRQFWLNQGVQAQGETQGRWPDVPDDAFAAMGHWKQSIWVIPSRDTVVVRTGDDRDGTLDYNQVISTALQVTELHDVPPPIEAPPVDPVQDTPATEETP
jgi:CubicO group peptidase (beta-lactamase class C family)